jgi:SAF domain
VPVWRGVSELMTECFQIARNDNVATLLADAEPGLVAVRGDVAADEIEVTQPIRIGHKVALREIREGEPVVKYGVTIGVATRPVARGEWVHLHNCRSVHDAQSSKLDVETGVREETPYA